MYNVIHHTSKFNYADAAFMRYVSPARIRLAFVTGWRDERLQPSYAWGNPLFTFNARNGFEDDAYWDGRMARENFAYAHQLHLTDERARPVSYMEL